MLNLFNFKQFCGSLCFAFAKRGLSGSKDDVLPRKYSYQMLGKHSGWVELQCGRMVLEHLKSQTTLRPWRELTVLHKKHLPWSIFFSLQISTQTSLILTPFFSTTKQMKKEKSSHGQHFSLQFVKLNGAFLSVICSLNF